MDNSYICKPKQTKNKTVFFSSISCNALRISVQYINSKIGDSFGGWQVSQNEFFVLFLNSNGRVICVADVF